MRNTILNSIAELMLKYNTAKGIKELWVAEVLDESRDVKRVAEARLNKISLKLQQKNLVLPDLDAIVIDFWNDMAKGKFYLKHVTRAVEFIQFTNRIEMVERLEQFQITQLMSCKGMIVLGLI